MDSFIKSNEITNKFCDGKGSWNHANNSKIKGVYSTTDPLSCGTISNSKA